MPLPEVEICCGCVPDLKAAAVIIAVLGIVTSPAVSWAVVRHTYLIRVSCLIFSNQVRPEVVDVNINNVISFGFGPNPGLGPTCLSRNRKPEQQMEIFRASDTSNPAFVSAVQYTGWVVLLTDLIFVICCVLFLLSIFQKPNHRAAKAFIIAAILTMFVSFVYSMMYVTACLTLGGAFPVFEFLFAFIDIMKWIVWIHFLLVIKTYHHKFYSPVEPTAYQWQWPWQNLWRYLAKLWQWA